MCSVPRQSGHGEISNVVLKPASIRVRPAAGWSTGDHRLANDDREKDEQNGSTCTCGDDDAQQ